jgi:hypothetical protein
MNTVKNRCLFAISILMVALGITSCVYSVFIRATGNLGQTITFKFFKSIDDERSSTFDIVGFTVQEQSADARWVAIWHLNGQASLSEIEYGKTYKGLDEVVPAKPLKQKVRYRVLVSGTTWPKPGLGQAGIDFFFDADGKLIQSTTSIDTMVK